MKNNTSKYLENYAEKEIVFSEKIKGFYENVVVIPSYNEYFEIKDLLEYNLILMAEKNSFLVILVINAKKNSNEDIKSNNNKLISFLEEKSDSNLKSKQSELIRFINYDILVINRSFENNFFTEKQGVGLARKIGCDIALKLFEENKINSPWIRCTDGDVIIPDNYFEINPNIKKYSCIVYDFYHDQITDDSLGKALILYEIYLRYYFFGLKYANSQYSFYTIGSCMAISTDAYTQVRGFSDSKEAGEDFYMMNKLSKIKPIFQTKDSILKIKCRKSDRVPFGTGASMNKISNNFSKEIDYNIDDPRCFDELKKVYDFIEKIDSLDFIDKFIEIKEEIFFIALKSLSFEENITKLIKISTDIKTFKKHFHNWFDSFKILKFIHFITNNYYPLLNWKIALTNASFIDINLDTDERILRDRFYEKNLNFLD